MSSGNWMRYLKKIKPYTIKKGIRYLKHYGPKEFWVRLCERMEPEEVPYGPWFENHKPSEKELEGQLRTGEKRGPLEAAFKGEGAPSGGIYLGQRP